MHIRRIIKSLIKKVLRRFGFYPSKIRCDMQDVLAHVKSRGFIPATIFDIGVANGTEELYEAFPESKFILIEPLVEFEPYIRTVQKKYDVQYIAAAASDNDGVLKFNVHPDLCGSSLLKEQEGQGVDGVEREVPAVTLNSLARTIDALGPVLIKIDVQGGELQVLRGASEILRQTEIVILEVSLFGFFIDGPEFFDVITFMKKRDFVAYEIFDGRNRPLDGALAQVDMVFVKEYGMFRQQHGYANKAQREKLNTKLHKMMES